MTEEEWLACEDPNKMRHYFIVESDRKWRLFACACMRRVWSLFPDDRSRRAVEISELFADGLATSAELSEAFNHAQDAALHWYGGAEEVPDSCAILAACGVDVSSKFRPPNGIPEHCAAAVAEVEIEYAAPHDAGEAVEWALASERAEQANLARDIFGNPFRPVAFDPAWRTDTAVSLARGMYDSRDFGAMPILADALQDAGCEDEQVLMHCREPGPHVRGCWVCDLVLGKA